MNMTGYTGPEPCWTCCGDGYLVDMHGPGTYSTAQDCWLPSEDIYPCPDCCGTGRDLGPHEPPGDTDNDPDDIEPWTPIPPLHDPLEPTAEDDLPF